MKNFKDFQNNQIKIVFCDIDDTITLNGQLHSNAYNALWQLNQAGIDIIPITGRPAGWCEMIARMWPVKGVVGENGAFYFSYNKGQMNRSFVVDEETRKENALRLKNIENEALQSVPGCSVASDQFCRLFDLAIDFCEDVPTLKKEDIQKIVNVYKKHGATVKVSSIHVNGWFGEYDKLSMCKRFVKDFYGKELSEIQEQTIFVGDSPNDEPMFKYFQQSFAVANITNFLDLIQDKPKFITNAEGGDGFTELVHHLLP